MIEADPVYALFLDEIEDIVQLLNVVVVDGEAQSHALTDGDTVLNALHGLFISTIHAAELVVDILEAVKGNAHIAHADILDALCHFPGNQRAIGRQGGTYPLLLGILGQLEKVRANQRLTAGKQQYRHMKISQIIYEFLGFFRGEFIFVLLRIGLHIAVHTLQVAGLGRVPDHNRPHALSRAIAHTVGVARIAQIIPIIIPSK